MHFCTAFNMAIIAQGAEAILTRKGNEVIKDRIKKSYRLPLIDNRIRKQRTKKESRLLNKASNLIPVPKVIKLDENNNKIILEFIQGKKLSQYLDKLSNNKEICKTIGKQISILHDNGIIHGDLTTSNMIYVPFKSQKNMKKITNISSRVININNPSNISLSARARGVHEEAIVNKYEPSDSEASDKVYFIDFGLGYESNNAEDKAVDLHLIKQALEAKHFEHYKKYWKSILSGYGASKHSKLVLGRLEAVEKRGRYKQAY
jgi:tRNA A-37 threonylcarbamoyl transferase component Bud32